MQLSLSLILFGGYLAVSITDFFQGVIMLIAMVMVLLLQCYNLMGGIRFLELLKWSQQIWIYLEDNFSWHCFIICMGSRLFWTTSYHRKIYVYKVTKMLPKARRLGISWMTVGLLGAVGVGLTGIAFIPDNHIKMDDPETLFIIMSQILFHPLVGGFLLAAILAAIMSTISSQLLVTSSSLTEDFYKLIRGEERENTSKRIRVSW